MKYFAILKDSIREARDSKVLLVLIVLSTIVSLLVATVSFKPLSAETTFAQLFPADPAFPFLIFMLNGHDQEKMQQLHLSHTLSLKKVELLRGDADSPWSDYALTVSASQPAEANADKAAESIRKIFHEATPLNFLQIGEVERIPAEKAEKAGADEVFRVVVHGSPGLVRMWSAEPSIMFGVLPMRNVRFPLGLQIYILASGVIGFGSWVAVIAAVIITSFFIPNMLRKGTVDLLLVKPIQRWALLIYKYLGGLFFMLMCATYAIVGIWLVLGLRTGLWGNAALLLIPTLTFFFAILYAISTFVSVLTRAAIPTIIVTIAAWTLIFAVSYINDRLQNPLLHESPLAKRPAAVADNPPVQTSFAQVISAIYVLTPRTAELDYLNDMIIFSSFVTGDLADLGRLDPRRIVWWQTLLVSGGWIAFFLLMSCLWFSHKDY